MNGKLLHSFRFTVISGNVGAVPQLGGSTRECSHGKRQTLPLSGQARLHEDQGAERRQSHPPRRTPSLRHSKACRHAPALRSPPRGRGVFKSWAVTKGPSLDPKDKRLAVETEDHPLDYGDFEGTIPKGEYGGGTVMLWDRGYWAPADGTNPEKALRKGELKFNLAGEKLQGGWVIVRMRKDRDGGKRNNWLLIKHRDGYEKEAGGSILDEDQSVASGRSMEAIAGGEGRGPSPFMLSARKAAVPDAVWHSNRGQKAVPLQATPASRKSPKIAASGDLPSFVPPQLCKTASRPPLGESWVHEIKLDGYRMQLRIGDGEARLRTPKGLEIGAHEGRNLDAVNQSKLAVVCGSVPTASMHASAPRPLVKS